MCHARYYQAGDLLSAKRSKSLHPRLWTETVQIRLLRSAQNLDALFREISVEARKRKPGTIDSWFTNLPVKANLLSLESQMKFFGMRAKETLHRNDRNIGAPA